MGGHMVGNSQALGTAIARLQSGQFQAAEQILRVFVQSEPHHADAWCFLGIALGLQNQPDESVTCFRRAVELKPGSFEIQTNLGIALLKQRHWDEAQTSLRAALALKPDHVLALNALGHVLAELGQLDAALDVYRQSLRIQPNFAETYIHLGIRLREQKQLDEALRCLRQALALRPHSVEALSNLGHCLREQADLDEALSCYQQALRLRPHSAEGHNDLGIALTDVGRLEEAAAHFREALRFKPDCASALCGLGELALHGRLPLTDEEVARVPRFLASNNPSPRERASLHLLQASLLDRQGRYEEAFAHYRQSNELRHGLLKAQGQVFDVEQHHGFIEALIAAFDRSYFQRVEAFGLETDLPVFIVGMPRSGTSLVEQILASHPRVFGGGELKEIRKIASALPPAPAPGDPASAWIGSEASRSLAGQYLRRLTDLGGAAFRVTDKMFDNYLHLGLIYTLFPRARVIHCRRQALDVCFSCYTQDFRGMAFTTSLKDLGRYHRAYAKLMAHWRAVLPQPMLEVDYEELVANQETESRRLIAFCGLVCWSSDSCVDVC